MNDVSVMGNSPIGAVNVNTAELTDSVPSEPSERDMAELTDSVPSEPSERDMAELYALMAKRMNYVAAVGFTKFRRRVQRAEYMNKVNAKKAAQKREENQDTAGH